MYDFVVNGTVNTNGKCGSIKNFNQNKTSIKIEFLPNDITPYLAQNRWEINLEFMYIQDNLGNRSYTLSNYNLKSVFYENFNTCKRFLIIFSGYKATNFFYFF